MSVRDVWRKGVVFVVAFSMLLSNFAGLGSIITFASSPVVTEGAVPAGNGTAADPFKIANADQLFWFAEKVNAENATYGNAHAVLTANITVNEGDVAGYDGVTPKKQGLGHLGAYRQARLSLYGHI